MKIENHSLYVNEKYIRLNQSSFNSLKSKLNSFFEKILAEGKSSQQIFNEMDKDRSGYLSFIEIKNFLNKYNF